MVISRFVIESASTSAPPVRTAVQRRGIERTQAILDSAEVILAKQGYAAATLKAIGEHAGIPTASLYHYFADRGQVEAELVRRHVPAIDQRFAASLYENDVRTLHDAFADAVSLNEQPSPVSGNNANAVQVQSIGGGGGTGGGSIRAVRSEGKSYREAGDFYEPE